MNTRELIEKGFYAGIGVLSLTKEKARALADDLVKRGEARQDEVEELVDRWAKRGEEERETLRKLVKDETERALGAANLATKADITALNKKIETLTQRSRK
jgi:polyhydroxyalkanoate synthesis regulator phasin